MGADPDAYDHVRVTVSVMVPAVRVPNARKNATCGVLLRRIDRLALF